MSSRQGSSLIPITPGPSAQMPISPLLLTGLKEGQCCVIPLDRLKLALQATDTDILQWSSELPAAGDIWLKDSRDTGKEETTGFLNRLRNTSAKKDVILHYTSNGGGNPGGSMSTSRDCYDIRSFLEAPRRKNTSSTTKNGDILGQAIESSGLNDRLDAWLRSPGPSQLSSGIGDICHACRP